MCTRRIQTSRLVSCVHVVLILAIIHKTAISTAEAHLRTDWRVPLTADLTVVHGVILGKYPSTKTAFLFSIDHISVLNDLAFTDAFRRARVCLKERLVAYDTLCCTEIYESRNRYMLLLKV